MPFPANKQSLAYLYMDEENIIKKLFAPVMIKQKQLNFDNVQQVKEEILKAGTVLVPKPEYAKIYTPGKEHVVTIEEEKIGATLAEKWMIKSVPVGSTSQQ